MVEKTADFDQRCLQLRIPYQGVWLVATWGVALALQTWSTFGGPASAGRWAIMVSALAAAWTAVFGVERVLSRSLQRACTMMLGEVEGLAEEIPRPVAEEVVRQMEMRELEAQVAQLAPSQPR